LGSFRLTYDEMDGSAAGEFRAVSFLFDRRLIVDAQCCRLAQSMIWRSPWRRFTGAYRVDAIQVQSTVLFCYV